MRKRRGRPERSRQEEDHLRKPMSGLQEHPLVKETMVPKFVCTLESAQNIPMPRPHPWRWWFS